MKPQLKRTVANRVQHIAKRCRTVEQVTRVWNWIDHREAPEPLWDSLRASCPWAFADPKNTNSMLFSYHAATDGVRHA